MKFLLDVCASSRALRTLLTELDHDVLSALEHDPRASDEVLLALAIREERVLVTEDKDFSELVFVRRLPHSCIIRFVDMRVEEKVVAMRELLERHMDAIRPGASIVVTRGRGVYVWWSETTTGEEITRQGPKAIRQTAVWPHT
jgi:predicted nuclease of predicted toxin-antitoxin system